MGVSAKKRPEPLNIKGSSLLKLEATTRFELVIRVLQTHALPLGYVAIFDYMNRNNILFRPVTPTRFELVLPP